LQDQTIADETCRLVTAKPVLSGQRRLALFEQNFVTDSRREHIINFLQPSKLGLKIANSSLKTAYFRNHAGVRPANMAKQSLRHCFEVLHTE
jgi:hypothetical protein